MSESSSRVTDQQLSTTEHDTRTVGPAPVASHRDRRTLKTQSNDDAFLLALEFLRDSETRLRLALDAAQMGTLIWRSSDDRYEPDRRMLALFGLPRGTSVSRDGILELIHPDDRERYADAFARAIDRAGTGRLREEVRVLHADGTVRWLSVIGQTTVDARGVHMSGVAADITDRKRREANLELLDRVADEWARTSCPNEIVSIVGARLGEYLDVSCVCLVDVDQHGDRMRVAHVWKEDGAPVRPEFGTMSDFLSADCRCATAAGATIVVDDTESDPRTDAEAHRRLKVRSFIGVPCIREGVWKFTLAACDSRPRQWRRDEVELFRRLAYRLFARLDHALAEQAVANDLRDTRLLRDLSVRLVSESDTQTFFDAIVGSAISMTGAQGGCLQLLDENNQLDLLAHRAFDDAIVSRYRHVDARSITSCGRALASGARAVIDFDDPSLPDPDGTLRLIVDAGIRSAQSTPLVTRTGRTVGMLTTHWSEPGRRLTEREERFLDLLTRQAAELIERRRQENALRDSERRLSAELADTQLLQRLSAQLIEDQGTASLYETLVDAARSIMRSEFASMQILHPERGPHGELRLIASRGFDDVAKKAFEWVPAEAHTSCARALQTGARVIAPDITRCDFMAGTADQATLLAAGIRASHSTPLVSRAGTTLGMISTHWTSCHRPSERNLRTFDILARQAADLIERAHAEEALRRSEAQLKEADRRKDEFLATLAHELRNPLAPLRTSLELIRLPGTPEELEETRLMMEEQVGVLVRLVDDLLDVSRISSGKIRLQRQPTHLGALIARAVQANQVAIDAGQLSLQVRLPDTPVLLDVDATRFVQVVSNVLNNAVKFTDPGGRITISAEVTSADDPGARELSLAVTDSGIGIPQDMLPRVFELFTQDDVTASRSHSGLGIGLALARRLIDLHGGSIDAFSEGPGLGSRFTIRIPVSSASVDVPAAASEPLTTRISCRVVVIDDNPAAARSIQRLVKWLGGECRVAHNGEDGLAVMRELRPDIVILDIGMPGLDGYATCRRIREEFGADVTLVALTGWGQQRDKQNAIEAGFDVHLTKPADPVALEELLSKADARGSVRP
jgi:PAS domain S-box-containing protein